MNKEETKQKLSGQSDSHYICLGGCRGVSKVPGVCKAPTCKDHNHGLVKCSCVDGLHYNFDQTKFK